MADRSDLWGPRVRQWMTEWHSPVAGFTLGKTFRGSGLGIPNKARVIDVSLQPRIIDVVSGGFRVTD